MRVGFINVIFHVLRVAFRKIDTLDVYIFTFR